jgi:hypothetical protein
VVYPYIQFEEQLALDRNSVESFAGKKLRLHLASKRISELAALQAQDDPANAEAISVTQKRYKDLVESVLNSLATFSVVSKNDAYIALETYFDRHYEDLKNLDQKGLKDIIAYVEKTRESVKKDIWRSTTVDGKVQKRYFVELSEGGLYTLNEQASSLKSQAVYIDDKAAVFPIDLSEGMHRIEMVYEVPKTIWKDPETTTAEGKLLTQNELKEVTLTPVTTGDTYQIQFEYNLSPQEKIWFTVFQGNYTLLRSELRGNGEWKTYSQAVHPNQNEPLSFSMASIENTGSNPEIELRNATAMRLIKPSTFFIKATTLPQIPLPTISSVQLDNTVHKVSIRENSSPFILSFNQTYNHGWRAYPIKPDQPLWKALLNQPVPESKHLMINTYANAWIIDYQENSELLIIFWPQVVFYIGLGVSSVMLTICVLTLLGLSLNKKVLHNAKTK